MFNVLGTHQGQFETSIGMTRGCDTKCPSSQFVTPLLHMTTSWTSHNGILYHDTNVPEACRSSAQRMSVEDSKMQYCPVNIEVLEQYRPSTEVIAGMVPVHHCFTATFVTVIYRFAHRHFTGPVLVNCYPTGISRHNYITLPVSYM